MTVAISFCADFKTQKHKDKKDDKIVYIFFFLSNKKPPLKINGGF